MKKWQIVFSFVIMIALAMQLGTMPAAAQAQDGGDPEVESKVETKAVSIDDLTPVSIPTVPTLVSPSGTIYDRTPTYKWTKISGATKYQVQVYRGTTKVLDKTYSSAYCGTTTCQATPTTALSYASHKWHVRAYKSGWKAYSAYKSFTVKTSTGFNSPFTNNVAGWSKIFGTWTLGGGCYRGNGVIYAHWASIVYMTSFSNLDYQVRMKRTGGGGWGSNTLVIHGTPKPLTSTSQWDKGLYFQYFNKGTKNKGEFSIYKIVNGLGVSIQNWTPTDYINSFDWNILRVKAKGSLYSFYINGHLIASKTLTDYPSGKVGILMASTATSDTLYVDWAKLTTTVSSSVLDGEEVLDFGEPPLELIEDNPSSGINVEGLPTQ